MTIDASAQIHPSAVIEDGAVIGPDCRIGPFCVVGKDVELGRAVTLKSHAIVTGWTQVGDDTVIFPFANIGDIPQDLKYAGERTRADHRRAQPYPRGRHHEHRHRAWWRGDPRGRRRPVHGGRPCRP